MKPLLPLLTIGVASLAVLAACSDEVEEIDIDEEDFGEALANCTALATLSDEELIAIAPREATEGLETPYVQEFLSRFRSYQSHLGMIFQDHGLSLDNLSQNIRDRDMTVVMELNDISGANTSVDLCSMPLPTEHCQMASIHLFFDASVNDIQAFQKNSYLAEYGPVNIGADESLPFDRITCDARIGDHEGLGFIGFNRFLSFGFFPGADHPEETPISLNSFSKAASGELTTVAIHDGDELIGFDEGFNYDMYNLFDFVYDAGQRSTLSNLALIDAESAQLDAWNAQPERAQLFVQQIGWLPANN